MYPPVAHVRSRKTVRSQRQGRARHRREPRAGPGDGAGLRPGRRRRGHREPQARRLRGDGGRGREVDRPPGAPRRLPRRRLGAGEALAEPPRTREFGKIDVLVNNAGMSPLYDRVDGVTEDLYDKVLDVNLKGPFRLTALVGARMADGDGGSIIMVSSTGRRAAHGRTHPVRRGQGGLNAMTAGFAHAFGPKVRVNCIMPGPFLTDISKAWDMERFRERARATMALGRGGEPGRDRRRGALLRLGRLELHDGRRPRDRRRSALSGAASARRRRAARSRPVRPGEASTGRRSSPGCAAPRRGAPRRGRALEVLQFPNGSANLTYLLRVGGHELVLRRPPMGQIAPGAHDMKREYKVLSDSGSASIGRRAPISSATTRRCSAPISSSWSAAAARWCARRCPRPMRRTRRSAADRSALVDAMADLHALDPAACGLADLGKPEGFVERQVAGWAKRWALSKSDDPGRDGRDPRAARQAPCRPCAACRSCTTT